MTVTPPPATDRGQVLPLAALLLALVAGAAVLIVHVGGVVDERARASSAADAAALAGAAEGEAAAHELAEANGGTLEHFSVEAGDTVVAVRVGRSVVRARASAARVVEEVPSAGCHPVHSPACSGAVEGDR